MNMPLKNMPRIADTGRFAAVRKHDIHAGLDFHCEIGTEVFAMQGGVVKSVAPFTGELAASPWWNDTYFIGIESDIGYLVYGEVEPLVKEGDVVRAGQVIGRVMQVLKKNKGLPTCMLHLELYTKHMEPVIWGLNEEKHPDLRDPTFLFEHVMFHHDASTHGEARFYLENRAMQLMHEGYFLEYMRDKKGGVLAFWKKGNERFCSFFVFPKFRSKGIYKKVIEEVGLPVLTVNDCQIVSYLQKNNIPHRVVGEMLDTKEYKAIESLYGSRKSKRSAQFLMNHINEGLTLLTKIKASDIAKRAFCLHPIIQSDDDLKANLHLLSGVDPIISAVSMEYRRVANAYLSNREIKSLDDIELSPLKDVNDMLLADKLQNAKDFELFHKNTHPRSKELTEYFDNWLKKLAL